MQGRVSKTGEPADLFVLFAPGKVPAADAIRAALEQAAGIAIGIDTVVQPGAFALPRASGGQVPHPQFEVVTEGLTFDLALAKLPEQANGSGFPHRYGFSEDAPETGGLALRIRPGAHLSGAERSLPVVRAQVGVALALVRGLEDTAAVGWSPSSALMERGYFLMRAEEWLAGGAFPAPGMIAFRAAMGGAIQSCGLAYFTRQELRLEAELASREDASTRLAAMLADRLVRHGPFVRPERIDDPAGPGLSLEPSRNGRFVRAWPQGI